MIAVRLQGGLGNQLFQYAAARALADRLDREVGLDLRAFPGYERRKRLRALPVLGSWMGEGDTPRPYLLDRYAVRARPLSSFRLLGQGFPFSRRLRRVWRRTGLGRGFLASEPDHAFQASLESRVRGADFAYLDGYWQSWRYFQDRRAVLLEDLKPRNAPSPRAQALLARMRRGNAVCLHVRRGDYVSQAAAASFHGLLGLEYYRAALKRLGPAARGATLYVFSDEPEWARRHLDLPGKKEVVDLHSPLEPEEDLRLMAACRHFVTANSSFSWWGAWLGTWKAKRVVAPKQWFRQGPATPDLCPQDWVRL